MLGFLAKLFTARRAAPPTPRTRLGVDVMEERFCPAIYMNPGTIRGFNPQPDPPAETRDLIAINPGEIRGFNPQPDPPATAGGLVRR